MTNYKYACTCTCILLHVGKQIDAIFPFFDHNKLAQTLTTVGLQHYYFNKVHVQVYNVQSVYLACTVHIHVHVLYMYCKCACTCTVHIHVLNMYMFSICTCTVNVHVYVHVCDTTLLGYQLHTSSWNYPSCTNTIGLHYKEECII